MADTQTQVLSAAEAISPAEQRFERARRVAGAVLAPVAFGIVYALADGLAFQGRMLSAILAAVAVLWVSEALPLPVTALLGSALCVVLGVADARTVLAPFADPIVFLFIGSFMLAQAMMRHGLDRRIALGFLSIPWVSATPARVLAGLGLVTALLSMWVSNTATTAMMLPIALGIVRALHEVRHPSSETRPPLRAWPFATGMLLMVAYGASIGGIATPVGSPPNLIGIAQIRKLSGVDIRFFDWMRITVPMLAVMLLALFVLLRALHPAGRGTGQSGGELGAYLRQQRAALGRWTAGQVNTCIAFALAVGLWILPGVASLVVPSGSPLLKGLDARLPEAIVALLAALLLFVLPVDVRQGRFTLAWSDAARIDWGTILLFGGGLSLGTLMFKTGVAAAMAGSLTSVTGDSSLWALTGVSIAMAIVLSETTSNTAAANMVIPVVIALAQQAHVDPVPPALGACLGASFGFMLPVSTPPNAIVYGSGLVPISRMVRAGIVFDVVGFFLIWSGLRVLYPLFQG